MKARLLLWLNRISVNGKLKTRLLAVYFLLIIVPLGLFSFYSYRRIQAVTLRQTLSAAQNAFDDTRLSLERTLGQLDEVIDILVNDPLVYSTASNDPADYTYLHRLEDMNQLRTTFDHLCMLSEVDRIRLYVKNDYPYSGDQATILKSTDVSSSNWYREAEEKGGRLWCSPSDYADLPEEDQGWFSSVQVIYSLQNVKEPMALLRVDIRSDKIEALMQGTSLTENGRLLLLHGNRELSGFGLSLQENTDETLLAGWEPSESGWMTLYLDGQRYFVQAAALSGSEWQIARILPYRNVFALSRGLGAELFAVVAVLGTIAYLLAFLISQSTLKRLSILTETMHRVEQGTVSIRLEAVGNDEIGQLMGSFDRMMRHLDDLMEEKIEYGRQIKNLELKALQAQINPHFLYNSLDLINCTAINRHVPEISRMVGALGRFYRLSLSGGQETISLADELKHAQLYVQIQNMRFEDRVNAVWDIDPDVLECLVIKIILQPLIENSIIHGIFEKQSKCGTLWVTVRRHRDRIRIVIRDDGVGMDETTRKTVFAPAGPIENTSGGYGVRNVQDRLFLAYGAPSGLYCESTPGEGTTVTVSLPAIEPDGQYD